MAEEVNPVSQRMLDEMIVDVSELDEKTAYEFVRKENPQYGTLPDDLIITSIKSSGKKTHSMELFLMI